MGALKAQIDWLKALPYYNDIVAVLGEYDDKYDYVGPEDWRRTLVPRTVYGLDINVCGYIHDYFYNHGRDATDRLKADLLFRHDIELWISRYSWGWYWNWVIKPLAKRRAYKYYFAVDFFGKASFNFF